MQQADLPLEAPETWAPTVPLSEEQRQRLVILMAQAMCALMREQPGESHEQR